MKYLLDSNIISDFYDKFSNGYSNINKRLSSLADTDRVYISILTIYELEYGYANAPDEKKEVIRKKITEAQEDFEILPLSLESSKLFGSLKKAIRESRSINKENIKRYSIDIMIATTAITFGSVLISADTIYGDLQKINPDLQLENWVS